MGGGGGGLWVEEGGGVCVSGHGFRIWWEFEIWWKVLVMHDDEGFTGRYLVLPVNPTWTFAFDDVAIRYLL